MDAKAPAAVTTFERRLGARGHHEAMEAGLPSTRRCGLTADNPLMPFNAI